MAIFSGRFGLQFTIHIANEYRVPELVDLADLARARGFHQVWINDNLRYRGLFVVLAAMAARVDIHLGTAVLVPYFRNPVEVAGALAALTELRPGRELSVGIARGDLGQIGQQLRAPKPVSTVRESVQLLRRLLDGEEAAYRDFPTLLDFFHLNPRASARLALAPRAPIAFFSGGNGPRIMQVAGRIMDGVLVSGMYIPFARSGRLAGVLAAADRAAEACDPPRRVRKVCELNVALSPEPERALQFARHYAAHAMLILDGMGFTAEEYAAIGVAPEMVQALKRLFQQGATVEEAARHVPDALARACFVIGSPEAVVDEVAELCRQAAAHGFEQVVFAKLGPDYRYAIEGLARWVVPAVA